MASSNKTQWNNTDSGIEQTYKMDTLALFLFGVVIVGIPGNVLVVVVYARKLTTSVRMYMLALALTDVLICVSYATTTYMGPASRDGPVYRTMWLLFNFGVVFSLLVLTVTAVERYWCIARPHSFTFSPRRGKVALLMTVAVAVAVATVIVIRVFEMFDLKKTENYYMMLHLGLCTFVILVMYTFLAKELIGRFRRKQVKLNPDTTGMAVEEGVKTQLATSSLSGEPPISLRATLDVTSVSRHQVSPNTKKIASVDRQTKEVKAALMLCVVTAVFLACWMPVWLKMFHVDVPRDLVRVYVIQSVINPVIYSCMSSAFREDVKQFLSNCRR